MARPRKPDIDLEELEKLCNMQATQPEMAAWFKMSLATFERRVQAKDARAVMDRGYKTGLISLRRQQFQLAMAGDKTMLIWLGKQYLGQRDNVDSIIAGPHGPLEFTVNPGEQLLAELAGIAARRLAKGSSGPAA